MLGHVVKQHKQHKHVRHVNTHAVEKFTHDFSCVGKQTFALDFKTSSKSPPMGKIMPCAGRLRWCHNVLTLGIIKPIFFRKIRAALFILDA